MPNQFNELKQMLEMTDADRNIGGFIKAVESYHNSEEEKKKEREEWLKVLKVYGSVKASCTELFNLCNSLNPVDPESPEAIYSVYKGRAGLSKLYKALLPSFGSDKTITFSFGGNDVTINKDELDTLFSKTGAYVEQCMRSWGMHPLTRKLMQEDYELRTECQKYFSD